MLAYPQLWEKPLFFTDLYDACECIAKANWLMSSKKRPTLCNHTAAPTAPNTDFQSHAIDFGSFCHQRPEIPEPVNIDKRVILHHTVCICKIFFHIPWCIETADVHIFIRILFRWHGNGIRTIFLNHRPGIHELRTRNQAHLGQLLCHIPCSFICGKENKDLMFVLLGKLLGRINGLSANVPPPREQLSI